MRLFKNRIFITIMCVIAAAAVAFYVIPNMYKNQAATAKVLRFTTSLQKGEQIVSSALEVVEMGALNLPGGLILDKAEVIGKYAQSDICSGDFVFAGKIGEYIFDRTLDDIIAQKKRLVTITLPSTAAGLSSHLKKGDIINIACYIPEREIYTPDGLQIEPSEIMIPIEMRNLTVYGVENAQTESTEHARELKEEQNTAIAADPVPKLVTLITTEAQALRLIEAEYSGKLHIIFVGRPVE
jgi:pilus assembly protein CpaB